LFFLTRFFIRERAYNFVSVVLFVVNIKLWVIVHWLRQSTLKDFGGLMSMAPASGAT
jgi:hypothetical protein